MALRPRNVFGAFEKRLPGPISALIMRIEGTFFKSCKCNTGADPGSLLGGDAPLKNDVTIQDFSYEGVHL